MTPERYSAIIDEIGEEVVLKRIGVTDLPLRGARVGMPTDSGESGTLSSDEFDVRIGRAEILAASWPEPPRNTDSIVIGGRTYTVLAAQVHQVRGAIYGYKLQVSGVA